MMTAANNVRQEYRRLHSIAGRIRTYQAKPLSLGKTMSPGVSRLIQANDNCRRSPIIKAGEKLMKMPCAGIRAAAMLCITLVLSACGAKRLADDMSYVPDGQAPSSDLPAAMSLMQPQGTYADLAELRHYSAYNAFHSTMSSGSSGNAVSATPAPAACFGNQ